MLCIVCRNTISISIYVLCIMYHVCEGGRRVEYADEGILQVFCRRGSSTIVEYD